MTVPTRGTNPTAFVDGSRLFWALLSPVHERLGYRVLAPDRIEGYAVTSALHIHGPVQDHVSSFISRSTVPTIQPRTVLAAVKAWPGTGGACCTRAATASLDGGCDPVLPLDRGRDGETAQSNKETTQDKEEGVCG